MATLIELAQHDDQSQSEGGDHHLFYDGRCVCEERQEWQLALGSLGTGLSRMDLAAAGSSARVGAVDVILKQLPAAGFSAEGPKHGLCAASLRAKRQRGNSH